jgi:hypothetical protein
LKLIGAELAAVARLYEWGGYDKNGKYLFDLKRPGWGKPIQQIMKDTGVTVFFQGHDHVFARELVDGVIYQTMPKPAEKIPDQQSFADAYQNCDKLLNSGFLKVDVTPSNVRVSYYRNYFVSSEPQAGNTGIVYSYTVDAKHNVKVLKSVTDDFSKYSGAPESSRQDKPGKKQDIGLLESGNEELAVAADSANIMSPVPSDLDPNRIILGNPEATSITAKAIANFNGNAILNMELL